MTLRGNRDYIYLATGEIVSTIGASAASFALPLIILGVTGSALQASMVATAGALGNLGASLFVGGWVDTHSRRSSLLISLVVRFAAWLAIAVLISVAFVNGYLIGAISMISGAAAALYRAAEAGALKAIIAGEDFPTALSVTEARGAVADLSGGPLGAAMMSISAALPFWFNSASYLASLAGILGVKTKLTRPPADGSKETFLHLLKGSISYLGSVPSFRYLLAGAALSNFAITAFNFAFIVLLQKAGESTWVIGLFQAAIGVGLLFGSVVAPRLIRRLTVGRLIVLSAILKTAIMLSLVVFHANVPIFLACTVVGYAIAPASSAAAMSPEDGSSHTAHPEDLDVPDATPDAGFGCPDLTMFCRLDELGLEVTGQRLEPDRAVLACRVVEPDEWCRRCGCQGVPRDTVIRRLAHEPFGWRPTTLLVTVRRYRCTGCGHVWRQDTSRAAEPRAKLSRRGLRWALEGIVVQHLTVARVAEGLGVSWNTANDAVLAEGQRVLIDDPHRFDGVTVIGVDEHVWRHTRRGDKYVTVIIDLTPIRDGTGPARLLDMVEGRSKQAFKTLARRTRRRRGATASRSSRWTGSPGSRPPPPRNCPTRSR